MEKTISIVEVIAAVSGLIAKLSLCVSWRAYVSARRNNAGEMLVLAHRALFNDEQSYSFWCLEQQAHDFWFDAEKRGAAGNFVGSKEEALCDLTLERLNLACMLLLKETNLPEERLFRKYIDRVYRSVFFEDYASFLGNAKSVSTTGRYFPYLHIYAEQRLGLRMPDRRYPRSQEDVNVRKAA